MPTTFIHKTVGVECTKNEYESSGIHYVKSGSVNPVSSISGSWFYQTTNKGLYFFIGEWEPLNPVKN